MDIAKQAEEIFFLGMQQGYACGGTPAPHPTLAGWERIVFNQDDWLMTDEWNSEGGNTLIQKAGVLVWGMRYYGHYPKKLIPSLKGILSAQYEAKVFTGGRGPEHVALKPGWYENNYTGDFTKFSGVESIHDLIYPEVGMEHIGKAGFHEFWGGMFI